MNETTQPDSLQSEASNASTQPLPTPTPPERQAPANAAVREVLPKESFSREYVAELRAEREAWQRKHQKTLAELNKVRQETQQHLTQTQQATRERILRAEMKALALKAGLRDLDCLKLADMSQVTLNDDDTLAGAQEMLAALKAAKPYLFTEPTQCTSPSETPPAPKAGAPESVKDLSDEAYQRQRAAYLHAV